MTSPQASAGPSAEAGAGPGPGVPPPITSSPRVGPRRRALQLVYDVAIGSLWAGLLPLFLLAGLVKRRLARKALSLSTVGLVNLGAPSPERPRILVHGVSVGEIKAAQSLVAALRDRYEVVVSAFSDTGLQVARQLFGGVEIVRYPFDFVPLVRRFWRRIQPDYVLLLELEAWPCFLREANRRGSPVAVVSGRITDGSYRRYRMFGSLPEFGRISLFAAQDETYAARFRELAGADERVMVTGNVKIDGLRVRESSLQDEGFDRLLRDTGLAMDAKAGGAGPLVITAGSTHDPEEAIFLRAALAAAPGARVIVVPRHPDRSGSVKAALEGVPGAPAPERLSELRDAGRTGDPARPLIVDTIGVLERIYGLSDIVYIGGSLVPHGGQNMMEPAAQGRPVLYGPHTGNFVAETRLLEGAGAALRVQDEAELEAAIRRLAEDPDLRRTLGERGRAAVASQGGATAATLEALRERCSLK